MKRKGLSIAKELGYASEILGYYDTLEGVTGGFDSFDTSLVDDTIRTYSQAPRESKGDVLLPLTQGKDGPLSYSYCILAHAFRTRGYTPVLPLCNCDLELCLRKDRMPDDKATCATCNYYGHELLDAFGLEPTPMGELLPPDCDQPTLPENPPNAFEYRGVDVAKFAKATAKRYLKKHFIDYTDDHDRSVYRRLLRSSMLLVDVAHRLFETYDIHVTIAHHGTYMYGGIYLDAALQYDVPSLTVKTGYLDQSLQFGNNRNRCHLPQFTDEAYLEEVLSEPLSESQIDRIDEHMAKRKEGENLRLHPAAKATESVELGDEATSIGVFTNLMWDASLEADTLVFTSPYHWVTTTIEYVAGNDDISLIIKAHPVEHLRETKMGISQWLEYTYDPLPENVTVLESDTDISPYQLITELDAGIVFNSTIGLEMAYEGIPVVVVSDTHYRGLGFTEDPDDVGEYLRTIDTADQLTVTEEMQRRARRYCHFLFIQNHIEFPFYEQTDDAVRLCPVSHEDIADSEVFDTIVEKAIAEEPIETPTFSG